ncbi:hypothetical protein [Sinorhizobium fredii]|uniref:hypothetical protein n=1 Tax=Rhizobium fredii TaxID=380 RepID=UPI0011D24AA5|nr:hypothetical protein [Sinorhizobium fredii]WOS64748.1 hypothetical protein SFGR64A_24565 [Sinorhizobium fredii GR64]
MAQFADEGRPANISSPAGGSVLLDGRFLTCADQGRFLGYTLVVTATCTIAAAASAVLLPDIRPVLLREDGIIETGSVALLGAAVFEALLARFCWARVRRF